MRRILKRVFSVFLVPVTRWYLKTERKHAYRGIEVTVFPGVFHPGLFSSTHFLIKYIEQFQIGEKKLLELGSGTGLISLWASKRGATVIASDLSAKAVANTNYNTKHVGSSIIVIQSDLFDGIQRQVFDWIVINPPYYARPITSEEELAWHCGENFEYFKKLFGSLVSYMNDQSQVLMILTREGCDVTTVLSIAEENSFYLELLKERPALLDGKDYLFRIRRSITTPEASQA